MVAGLGRGGGSEREKKFDDLRRRSAIFQLEVSVEWISGTAIELTAEMAKKKKAVVIDLSPRGLNGPEKSGFAGCRGCDSWVAGW